MKTALTISAFASLMLAISAKSQNIEVLSEELNQLVETKADYILDLDKNTSEQVIRFLVSDAAYSNPYTREYESALALIRIGDKAIPYILDHLSIEEEPTVILPLVNSLRAILADDFNDRILDVEASNADLAQKIRQYSMVKIF